MKDPYKKFRSEKIDFRCFRAIIHPKIKIFGTHVKFPKKIRLEKKISDFPLSFKIILFFSLKKVCESIFEKKVVKN